MVLCHFLCDFFLFPSFLDKQKEEIFGSMRALFWSAAIELPIIIMLITSGVMLLCMMVVNAAVYYIVTDMYNIGMYKYQTKAIVNFLQIILTLTLFMVIL